MEKPFALLLATDYSEVAMNAERYAIQLALSTNSFLRILHVFDHDAALDSEKPEYNPALQEIKKLKEHVSQLLNSLNIKQSDLNYECVVREGSAAQQIKEEANEVLHDFIIVGTHGASGIKSLLFGSHTWNLIKKSNCPILAIPAEAFFKPIKKIVFATEFREGELPVINFLTQVAKQFDAELNVLHISASVLSKEIEKKVTSEFLSTLKDKIVYPDVKIHVIHNTDIVSGIAEFCELNKADWLVMAPEKPNFMEKIFNPSGSLTKKMNLHTTIPLLSIPDYYNPDFAWFWKLFTVDYSQDTD